MRKCFMYSHGAIIAGAKSKAAMAFCLLAVNLLSAQAAQAAQPEQSKKTFGPNLVVNGDFEVVPVYTERRDFHIVKSNQSDISGWSVYKGNVNVFQDKWKPISGVRCLDLNGSESGSVFQTIATEIGASYQLEFYLAGNIEAAPAEKKIFVRAGGQSATYSFDSTGCRHDNLGWRLVSWTFKAIAPETNIEIGSLTDGTHAGALIDLVSVRKINSRSQPKAHRLACSKQSTNTVWCCSL